MKKILLASVAAGALAMAGAASAQSLDGILTNILGFGGPNIGTGTPAPANGTPPLQGSYRDEYGRLWVVEQGGHHVMIPDGSTYGITGYSGDGRPMYGAVPNGGYAASRFERDSDRDGVPDSRDRRPFDSRRR